MIHWACIIQTVSLQAAAVSEIRISNVRPVTED